ncbi:MAG: hypothetical protein KC505_09095 [Myxococcales bacterium]|nr:hypothetical protein [Myxococcales bacterium]
MELSSAKNYKIKNLKNNIELEIKIFERIVSDNRCKDISHPFAVLEISEDEILLGSTQRIVNAIHYNFSLKLHLQEAVGAILNDDCIKIQLKIDEDKFLATKKNIEKLLAKRKDEEKFLLELNSQKMEGRCDLMPFPLKENKVRSDLTVERHAIFAANTFKGDFRTYERTIKDHQTNDEVILRIEVGDQQIKGLGVLKQKHQEVFYKLSQLWGLQNYKIKENSNTLLGSLELSRYELVQAIRNTDGGTHYKSVLQLLKEMSTIRINIKKLYKDGTIDCQDFTLLSYEWSARRFNEHTGISKSGGYAKVRIFFSEFVTNEFLRKNIKSLMLAPYLSLKDKGRKGVAQLLYTTLDYELSTKEKFNILLKNLYKRLGLAEYKFKSDRKRKLEPIIEQIKGQKILNGEYKINAYLSESEDKKDWVFIARRIPE